MAVVTAVTKDYGFNERAASAGVGEGVPYVLSATGFMTAAAARGWRHTVDVYANTDSDSANTDMFSFALFRLNLKPSRFHGKKVTRPESGPLLVDRRISEMHVSVASDGRLKVEDQASSGYRVSYGGKPFMGTFHRNSTYWLVRGSDGWRIDAWYAHFHSTPIGPEH